MHQKHMICEALSLPPSELLHGLCLCLVLLFLLDCVCSLVLACGVYMPCRYSFAGPLLCDSRVLDPAQLAACVGSRRQSPFSRLLLALLRAGFFYPVDL